MFDLLEQDKLDSRHLDMLIMLAATIAGGSAELARLVGSTSARGISHCIPTSLLLILVQHAHEQRAGRADDSHPLGSGRGARASDNHGRARVPLRRLGALHLRVVQTSDHGFVECLGDASTLL